MNTVDASIIILNVAAYGSLAAGLVQIQRQRISKQIEILEAFPLLEANLRKAFPKLPAGFTWREGISLAKGLGLELRWDEIDNALSSYEAHKYGGRAMPDSSPREVMKLAGMLGRYT